MASKIKEEIISLRKRVTLLEKKVDTLCNSESTGITQMPGSYHTYGVNAVTPEVYKGKHVSVNDILQQSQSQNVFGN